jgi:photosystem II stability/assembly factor-like uncharacterized protein
MRKVKPLFVAAAVTVAVLAIPESANAKPTSSPSWRFMQTVTTSTLFGVDVVNRNVVWAAGGGPTTDGVVVRTVDGGQSWQDITPPGGAVRAFHDVEAFDRNHAVVLAVGQGQDSRIYRTDDGGASWQLAFENQELDAFYDCMAFFDDRRGLALSDPVDGKFRILATGDGGRTWRVAPTGGMPPAMTDEFAHASGTCLVTNGPLDAWFGTAPAPGSNLRVFHTRDGGRTWMAVTTPIPAEPTFGITSLSFRDRQHGLAVSGGSLDTDAPSVVAGTADGGETWSRLGSPTGFRFGIAWVPTNTKDAAVAVGPTGSDFSTDGGLTWRLFDETYLLGVNCQQLSCWAAGLNGIAAELTLTKS